MLFYQYDFKYVYPSIIRRDLEVDDQFEKLKKDLGL